MLLLRSFVPLGMMFFIFVSLLITQTIFGLIIVGLLAVTIPLVLLPNKRAASASAKMERLATQTAKKTTLVLASINNQNKEQSESMETALAPLLNARDQRMIAVQFSRLIGSVILAGVITLCLAMLLTNTLAFSDNPVTLATVFITIIAGMKAFRSTNTTITSINRFYTQIRRFAGFVQGIPIDGFEIGSPKLSRGIHSDMTVPSGSFIGVLTPVPLDRVSVGWLTLLLFKSAMRDEIYLDCCGETNCSDASITYVNACDNNPQDKVRGIRLLITNDLGLLEGTPLFDAFEVDAKGAVRVLDKDNVFKDLDDTSTEELSLSGDNLEVELEMEMEM
jgi:ABC-type multidrug transport system fused ATPase/permease subunit